MKQNVLGFETGSALLEVLITIVILAFGLLGLAGLQARVYVLELESYQRAQALVMLNDISERIKSNAGTAAFTSAANILARTTISDCDTDYADPDVQEICRLISGAAEQVSGSGVGGMQGTQACVTPFTLTNKVYGFCQTGIQVDVAWQGRSATIVPAAACGTGDYGGNDALRRVITTRIPTGEVAC